jgi:rhodanese-related sulfurtransferase
MRAHAPWIAWAVALLAAGCGGGSAAPTTAIREAISVQQAYAMTQARAGDPTFVVLDVRTPGEYAAGHLENAVNLDVNSGTFAADVALLNRGYAYLVYCQAGARSAQAVDVMANLGFLQLYDMLGGYGAWVGAGYPVTP